MWTLTDTAYFLGALALQTGLFYLPSLFKPGSQLLKQSQRIIDSKKKYLKTNPILKAFAWLVDHGKEQSAGFYLAFLIFIKSAAMFVFGYLFFFIPFLFVLVQGFLMVGIRKVLADKNMEMDSFRKTQNLQFASMILLSALGSWAGFTKNWQLDYTLSEVLGEFYLPISIIGFLSYSFALLAGRQETRFFKAHRTMIS